MRILFMGTPDFAVPSLESLVAAGHTVCGVFTQPDKPRNRGMKLQAPPVKVCALAHNIPVYQPVKLRDGAALALIQELAPELITPKGVHQRPLVPAAQLPGGGPHPLGGAQRGARDRRDHHAHGPRSGRRRHHRPGRHPH